MKIRKNNRIEKEGINYIKSVVDDAKCIFHQLQLENDYGIDAIIELTKDNKLNAILVAAQIKSGSSYCSKAQCHVQSDREHFEYWHRYPLPVVAIVYDPTEKTAYWYDIKFFLNDDRVKDGPYRISFNKNDYTRFNKESFKTFFLTANGTESLCLNFKTSVKYSQSDDYDISHIGVYSLIKNHIRCPKTWKVLFALFRAKPPPGNHGQLINLLSSIIDHHNMAWYAGYTQNLPFEDSIREEIRKFTKNDVIKMLKFIHEEDDFSRIHMSKNINDVLTLIPKRKEIIREIINDKSLSVSVRESALMLTSCWEGRKILTYLKTIKRNHPELENRISFIRSFFKFAKNQDDMNCFD